MCVSGQSQHRQTNIMLLLCALKSSTVLRLYQRPRKLHSKRKTWYCTPAQNGNRAKNRISFPGRIARHKLHFDGVQLWEFSKILPPPATHRWPIHYIAIVLNCPPIPIFFGAFPKFCLAPHPSPLLGNLPRVNANSNSLELLSPGADHHPDGSVRVRRATPVHVQCIFMLEIKSDLMITLQAR